MGILSPYREGLHLINAVLSWVITFNPNGRGLSIQRPQGVTKWK